MSSSIYLLPRRFRSKGVASYLIKKKKQHRNRHIIRDDFLCKAKCNVTVLKMPITYRMHKMERHHKFLLCFTFANLQFSLDIFSCFFKSPNGSSVHPLLLSTHSFLTSNHRHITSSFFEVLYNGSLSLSLCCSISHLSNDQTYFLVSKLCNVYKRYT